MVAGVTISHSAGAKAKHVEEKSLPNNSTIVEHPSRRPLPQYKRTMEKLNAFKLQLESLKGQLVYGKLSADERERVQLQIEELNAKLQAREEMADFVVSRDGKTVTFTLNDYYMVEKFKEAFGVKDGALREALGREALAASDEDVPRAYESFDAAKKAGVTKFANGVYIDRNWFGVDKVDYSRAILQVGHQYSFDSSYLK